MSTTRPILITVPKYITISPNPVQKFMNQSANEVLFSSNLCGGECDDDASLAGRGKKRRLDHLTWEEKIQRKKLKNRVAAQTSRDRKKAKMDDMERTIKVLTQQTEILQNKCDSLQLINESLLQKNCKLDRQVEELQKQLDELKNNAGIRSSNNNKQQEDVEMGATMISDDIGYDSNTSSIRSAVSIGINNPLLKGIMESKSISHENSNNNNNNTTTTAALWKIIALCLLYKTCCSKISMQENWKNLQKVYSRISPQTWKQIIHQAALMMPKMQAVQSDCLDQWWGPQQKSWNPAKISVTA